MKIQSKRSVVSTLSVGFAALALGACGGEGVTRPELPSSTTDAGPDAAGLSDAMLLADASVPAEVVTLTIDAPVAGQWVNSRRLEVRGTFTGSPEAITVDAALRGGACAAIHDLTSAWTAARRAAAPVMKEGDSEGPSPLLSSSCQ